MTETSILFHVDPGENFGEIFSNFQKMCECVCECECECECECDWTQAGGHFTIADMWVMTTVVLLGAS